MAPRVLVIDDDEPIRNMLVTYLGRAGFEPLGAPDGIIGLDMFRSERPDAMIVDVLLPQVMGFDICRAVRESPHGRAIPIIVMSAVQMSRQQRDDIGKRLAISHFLWKPFQFRELLDVLGAVVPREAPPKGERAAASDFTVSTWTPDVSERGFGHFRAVASEDDDTDLARDLPFATLPELLFALLRRRANGVLYLFDESRQKEISFTDGVPVQVVSMLPGENLAQTLINIGRIDLTEFDRAIEIAARDRVRIEEALVIGEILDSEEIVTVERLHAREIIRSAFTWYGFSYRFCIGEEPLPGLLQFEMDPFALVWEGISTMLSLPELTAHFTSRRREYPVLTPHYGEVSGRLAGVLPTMTLAESLDGTEPFVAVLARSSVGLVSSLRVLYLLEACRAMDFVRSPRPATGTETVTPKTAIAREGSVEMADAGVEVSQASSLDALVQSVWSPEARAPGEAPPRLYETAGAVAIEAEQAFREGDERLREGRFAEARAAFEKAIAEVAGDPRFHVGLATAILHEAGLGPSQRQVPAVAPPTKALEDAEAALAAALKLDPRNPHALSLLARLCVAKSRPDKAAMLYGLVRQIDPEFRGGPRLGRRDEAPREKT